MGLEQSKTFSSVFIGLLALSLVVGGIGFVIQGKQKPVTAEATTDDGESTLQKAIKVGRDDMIALIRIEGPITSDASGNGLLSEQSNALMAREALDKAAEDDKVKGVIMLINTPGGTVGMSQELNAAVRRVRANKPIVASLLDIAASGGYYTACAADKIITNRGTLTASIGVIMQTFNFHQLMDKKLGISSTTIRSGKFKDLLNPYRETRPEEIALLQDVIDDSYADFLGAVLDGRLRNMEDAAKKSAREAKIREVADGRIVTGNQAIEYGLADELGDLRHAKEVITVMINERTKQNSSTKYKMLDYEAHTGALNLLGLPFFTGSAPSWMQVLINMVNPAKEASLAPVAIQAAQSQQMPFATQHANQPLWLYQ